MKVCVKAQWREHPSHPSVSPTCETRKQSRVFLSAPTPTPTHPNPWAHTCSGDTKWRRTSTFSLAGPSAHHHHERHYCWTSCQLQKRLVLLKNNVAVRSPRISPSPQREGGALQRLAAPCSVQPGWDCCLSTAASSTVSVFIFFFQEKQSTRQQSLGEGLFWMLSSPGCVTSLLQLRNPVTILSTDWVY